MYEPDTTTRRSRWPLCAMMLLLLGSTTAYAQEKPPEAPSRAKLDKKLRRANKLLEYNSITRAIRAFEYIVRHDSDHYSHVYFTLAQLYEYKKKYRRAALCYLAYLEHGWEEEFVSHSKRALARLRQPDWHTLRVRVATDRPGHIRVNGYVLKRDEVRDLNIRVPRGTYEVTIDVEKHQRDEYTVELKTSPVLISSTPVAKLVHGEFKMTSNIPTARVVLLQERADSHKGARGPERITLPMSTPLRLPTGKYLLEVVEPSHEPWHRRFRVEDGDLVEFEVRMQRALPDELRYTHVFNPDGSPKVPIPEKFDPKVALPAPKDEPRARKDAPKEGDAPKPEADPEAEAKADPKKPAPKKVAGPVTKRQ